MARKRYIGIIGSISFVFACLQLLLIYSYPMVGYIVFRLSGGGSYSPQDYTSMIPRGFYVSTIALFVLSFIALTSLPEDA